MELSQEAAQELAAYKQTGELDCSGALYNEVYEYFANDMHPRTRQRDDRQYTYVMRRIKRM